MFLLVSSIFCFAKLIDLTNKQHISLLEKNVEKVDDEYG